MLDISDLKTLQAIVATGSLNRAALELNQTQPTLSKKVSRLEKRMRQELFYRGQSGMVPTRFTLQLLQLSESIFTEAKHLERQIELMKSLANQKLFIGVSPGIEHVFIPEVIPRLISEHQGLSFKIEVGSFRTLTDAVLAGDLDFAVTPYDPDHLPDQLRAKPFIRDEFTLACRPNHPLTQRDSFRMSGEDFYQYPLITPELSEDIKNRLHALVAKQKNSRFSSVECHNFILAASLVKRSDCIVGGPRLAFQTQFESGDLKELRRPMKGWWNPAFISRPESFLSNAVQVAEQGFLAHAEALSLV